MQPHKKQPGESRLQGTVGYAAGVWDLLHYGHISLLKRVRAQCDYLVVGVCTDSYTTSYKVTPFETEERRIHKIEGTGLADKVVLVDHRHALVYEKWGITHLFHGDDWEREQYIEHMDAQAIASHGIEVVLLAHTPGISSTLLRSREVEAEL